MKFGVAVSIVEHGYVEVEADCPAEAKDIAEQMALGDDVLFHNAELHDAKIELTDCPTDEHESDSGGINWVKEILSSEEM